MSVLTAGRGPRPLCHRSTSITTILLLTNGKDPSGPRGAPAVSSTMEQEQQHRDMIAVLGIKTPTIIEVDQMQLLGGFVLLS